MYRPALAAILCLVVCAKPLLGQEQDTRTRGPTALSDPAVLAQVAVTSEELTE